MRPADLALVRVPGEPTLSPDGSSAVVAVTRLDLEADAYRSELWELDTAGDSVPRRLTNGPRDTAPRFSPDGRWLAFLRAEDGGKPQLHVLPTAGGEPRPLPTHPLGVQDPSWSPDSTRIAYVARVPETGRYGTDPEVPEDREPPRRITTLRYRLDGIGFTIDRRAHVFVVDVRAPETAPVQVTHGDFDHADPAWHPDGEQLAFCSARHDSRDDDLVVDVFVAPLPEGDARQVTRSRHVASRAAFTPDGTSICFASPLEVDVIGRNTAVWRVPTDGSAAPQQLSDHEAWDLVGEGPAPLVVEEERVLSAAASRGCGPLVAVPLTGGAVEPLVAGPRQVHGYDARAGCLALVVTDGTSAGELVVRRGGDERTVSDFGATLARDTALRPLTELDGRAPDGYPVHGWVVKPAGRGPFPVLLAIHGGPFRQYGHAFFDEAQVYAGAGYAVVLANPRGSAGYGQAHGRAIVGDLGNLDAGDVLALLDTALEDQALDARRVGVMGGSYGGFLTTWLAATAGERFRAAISERSVNAWDSFTGSSDIGFFFAAAYTGADAQRQLAQSPLSAAQRIAIPLLIVHAEQDWRCPIEQAQRLFVRLKQCGVETEMLLFPGEGHELSRSGLPSHRLARFDAILEWWSRHLQP